MFDDDADDDAYVPRQPSRVTRPTLNEANRQIAELRVALDRAQHAAALERRRADLLQENLKHAYEFAAMPRRKGRPHEE